MKAKPAKDDTVCNCEHSLENHCDREGSLMSCKSPSCKCKQFQRANYQAQAYEPPKPPMWTIRENNTFQFED